MISAFIPATGESGRCFVFIFNDSFSTVVQADQFRVSSCLLGAGITGVYYHTYATPLGVLLNVKQHDGKILPPSEMKNVHS